MRTINRFVRCLRGHAPLSGPISSNSSQRASYYPSGRRLPMSKSTTTQVQAWTLATPDISRAFIDDPKLREPTAAAPGPSPTANLLLDGAIKPAQATEASERRATHLSVPSSTRSRPPTSP